MSDSIELKRSGLKVTYPRVQVLRVFHESDERHLSAEDVYAQLLNEKVEVGLATIYRVLSQLEHAGLLSQAHFGSNKAVYELNDSEHHDHMVCTTCGQIEEFRDDDIEKRQDSIASGRGFEVTDHSLTLYCRCLDPQCEHHKEH